MAVPEQGGGVGDCRGSMPVGGVFISSPKLPAIAGPCDDNKKTNFTGFAMIFQFPTDSASLTAVPRTDGSC